MWALIESITSYAETWEIRDKTNLVVDLYWRFGLKTLLAISTPFAFTHIPTT